MLNNFGANQHRPTSRQIWAIVPREGSDRYGAHNYDALLGISWLLGVTEKALTKVKHPSKLDNDNWSYRKPCVCKISEYCAWHIYGTLNLDKTLTSCDTQLYWTEFTHVIFQHPSAKAYMMATHQTATAIGFEFRKDAKPGQGWGFATSTRTFQLDSLFLIMTHHLAPATTRIIISPIVHHFYHQLLIEISQLEL